MSEAEHDAALRIAAKYEDESCLCQFCVLCGAYKKLKAEVDRLGRENVKLMRERGTAQ